MPSLSLEQLGRCAHTEYIIYRTLSLSPSLAVCGTQHSKEDEQLVEAALQCGPPDGHLMIFDARSFSAATGNKIMVHVLPVA